MLLQLGDKGSAVKKLQEVLKIKVDGDFGPATVTAVKAFQTSKGLKADGIVGENTAKMLRVDIEGLSSTDLATSSVVKPRAVDTSTGTTYTTQEGLVVHKYLLDNDEYVVANTTKHWLLFHHTAGSSDPFATVKQWNDDTRGRIATQYVIGGISTKGDAKNDGVVVECFPDQGWAYHLGDNGNSHLHPESIGIEICNYGFLELRADGKYYNYVGSVIPNDQVCDLGSNFNGHRYYHKYTDKQIENLGKLCKEIARRHPNIDLKSGLQTWLKTETAAIAFGYKDDAYFGKIPKGILTHTNIRKDKTDCSPQPNLIRLIQSL